MCGYMICMITFISLLLILNRRLRCSNIPRPNFIPERTLSTRELLINLRLKWKMLAMYLRHVLDMSAYFCFVMGMATVCFGLVPIYKGFHQPICGDSTDWFHHQKFGFCQEIMGIAAWSGRMMLSHWLWGVRTFGLCNLGICQGPSMVYVALGV